MRYVQVVLTESQVALNAAALANSITQNDDAVEREQLGYLADFFYAVEANPAAFPVSPKMARTIKKLRARAKGPAPEPKLNKRLRKQAASIGNQKRTRAAKREAALLYNAAREAALELQAQEDAPKSTIILPGQ